MLRTNQDNAPLAYRMARARSMKSSGRGDLAGKLLRRMIENDRLASIIFFGPRARKRPSPASSRTKARFRSGP